MNDRKNPVKPLYDFEQEYIRKQDRYSIKTGATNQYRQN